MPSILTYLSASLLYGIAGWYFWRTLRTAVPALQANAAGMIPNVKLQQFMMFIPLIVHGVVLYHSVFMDDMLSFGVGNAISAIVWLTALIYWVSGFFPSLRGLQNLMAPISAIAAIAVLVPLLLPSVHPLAHAGMTAFVTHLLAAMLAYSLFTIAALHAALMTLLERRLHHPVVSAIFVQLPPLLVMDKMLFRLVWIGFILLSLTLLSGIVFSEELFGKSVPLTHKSLFGFVSWGIFAALLAGRHLYGWRGRTAIRWLLAGFVALVLSYLGSKFVLEIILDR
ncbi:cytochrome C biogenesis protein [Nitrosomonas sp. HPC101]|uniref:cytochrome C assembly family protein n=1 Tax=Nitrosomonas sp. HPC101 TaxID=1658667 RepID=UPI00136C89A1|nr:cytochrome c biogenesis protein CcsA [Nitrosomonas sp. HPC101]MXS85397.1 cytochrome C biogenesis protein [Nitrosomonas sp. HPC101]